MAVTAVVTLGAAGLLTWSVLTALASPAEVRPASGLPSDPCSEVGEAALDAVDGEFYSWYTGTYSNGCTWTTSLADQEETRLFFRRSVPMSEADATLAEEIEDEVPRDADALYQWTVDEAGELGYESEDTAVVDTEEKALDFGDESVLVVADIDYGHTGSVSQNVTLVVRDGDLVSRLSVTLSSSGGDTVDADEAEDLLADVATDLFG
ncbi:hypothetical protein [Nocardiopsis aegyptia]|uniref:DUF3558 domain-containing protein n=1 Tax=Nocardiopsis aegyptia TaxID=220378 RepID=A0A7Z0JBE5_9ACTN|nr:hypothetical protein [Nocardiopsis aegyptia]NYJ35359.1 hypothetical protein [Nocardiopsis aegyptia]